MALQVRPCACMCVYSFARTHLLFVYPEQERRTHNTPRMHTRTQVAMPPVYLAAVRPFREALLQAVELTCHALEAGLFACALALVNARRGPPSHGW